jgi:hypothetical protein
VTTRLEHIGDETINNFTMKRVVCPNVVWNVSTFGKHQNDQVSTQGLLVFLRGEYSESSESLSVTEDCVASLPNLEDMHWKEALLIGPSSWCKKECNFLDLEGIFFTKGCVAAFNLREAILDDMLGHDHVGLTIFYCTGTFHQ